MTAAFIHGGLLMDTAQAAPNELLVYADCFEKLMRNPGANNGSAVVL